MEQTVLWMFWVYWVVVLPLAFESIAGPVILKQLEARAFFACIVLLWLAPVAITHLYGAAPKPFGFYLPVAGIAVAPWLAHTICYGIPVGGAAAAIWIARKLGWSLVRQMFAAALAGGLLLFIAANDLVLTLLRMIFKG